MPSDVLVNGIKYESCKKTCNLEGSQNNITLIFASQIETCQYMFRECKNITYIDLSYFDTSKVKNMYSMFYDCSNLEKINFGKINTSLVEDMGILFCSCKKITSIDLSNFDTSKVKYMHWMFSDCPNLEKINIENINTSLVEDMSLLFCSCKKITSIDLSNFDTSKVKYMHWMFYGCSNLKYLDLSNFVTSKVDDINSMFKYCKSLIYLNIYSFDLYDSVKKDDIFSGMSSYTKYCANNDNTKKILSEYNKTSDCSDTCFKNNIKIDLINNKCVLSCINNEYEDNNICYNECPEGSYIIFKDENNEDGNIIKCFDKKPEGYYLDINNKIYKKCFNICKYCNGPGNETIHNCIECKTNYTFINDSIYNTNCYEKCDYNYYFDKSNKYHCEQTCPIEYNKIIKEKNKCIDDCKKDDIYKYEYNNICYQQCPNETIINEDNYICSDNINIKIKKQTDINETINSILSFVNDLLISNNTKSFNSSYMEKQDQILEKVQDIINNGLDTTDIKKGNDITMNTGTVNYTITTTSNQKNNKNNNVSTINLGECENKLKEKYNISKNDTLYILKVDVLIDSIKKVEYDAYYPFFSNILTKLDLSICKDIKIDISIPMEISKDEIDKYNISSDLYNDICYISSENGTDKPLKARQNEYKDNNLSVCEENCDFIEYDDINNKAICSCFTKIKLPIISEIKVDKDKLYSNLKDIKNIGNFKMLKCKYLIFKAKSFLENSANYITMILFVLSIIAIFVFIFISYVKIKEIIIKFSLRKKEKINNEIIFFNNNNKKKNINQLDNINSKIEVKNNIINSKINAKQKVNKTKKRSRKKTKFNNNNPINSKQLFINNDKNNQKQNNDRKINLNKKNKIINNNTNINKGLKGNNLNEVLKKNIANKKNKKIINNDLYNDYELNNLNYVEAKVLDNRSYSQYYISLLKTKHILISSFCQTNDYNSQPIKIYIFFITFEINYLVSAMFYSDATMNKIYEDSGSFDFTYQLPKMVYSLIISTIIKSLLNFLGLYEPNIISYKRDKHKNTTKRKELLFNIKIMILFFFIISYILLFFFWIYLGCFCAVYKNTQLHLFIDVISSFGLSFITPFFINLFPGLFRIASLRSKTKRPFMFKFSKLLQLL